MDTKNHQEISSQLPEAHQPALMTCQEERRMEKWPAEKLAYEMGGQISALLEVALDLWIYKTCQQVSDFIADSITPLPVSSDNPILFESVAYLEITPRVRNRLRKEGISCIGELVQRTEAEILLIRQLHVRALIEIKKALHKHGLGLGMRIDGWQSPAHQED